MLLQALVEYYDILASKEPPEVPHPGYSCAKVSYSIVLSQKGEIKNVIPLKIPDRTGKKYVAQTMIVPEQVKKTSGAKSNFLCENAVYTLGYDYKGKPESTKKCYEEFKKLHFQILEGVGTEAAEAMRHFVSDWKPEYTESHPELQLYLEDLAAGANLVFQYDGQSGYLHEQPEIRRAWETFKEENSDSQVMQCMVTGKRTDIARLHPSLKGIRGGQSSGSSLISFNDRAYESYGRDKGQGLNSPVSEAAAFKYGAVLNHLLADEAHKMFLGDTTVVFWAETPESSIQDMMAFLMNPTQDPSGVDPSGRQESLDTASVETQSDKIGSDERQSDGMKSDESASNEVKKILYKISRGERVQLTEDIFEPETKIYILGLSPNAARLSVRFFIRDSFGGFTEKICRHYQDMAMEKQYKKEFDYIPVWKLLSQTVSPKARDKNAKPLLAGSVMRSILQGFPYPQGLLDSVMIRIHAEKEINYYKASIIKACLLRKDNIREEHGEVLTLTLNETSKDKAYVLGRLFAVLEKAQEEANPGINTTIKDRYFNSASATPSLVFPTLLKLSMNHIKKAKFGYTSDNRIRDIMALIQMPDDNHNAEGSGVSSIGESPFPKTLSLEDQGVFILGYYHQKNALYRKQEEK